MTTPLSHLPGREQRNLRTITQNIVQTINPEWLFCYGGRTTMSHCIHCFSQPGPTCRYEHVYELAVIVSQQDKRNDEALQDLVKDAATHCSTINVLVYRNEEVLNALRDGDYFFSLLFRHGWLLHGSKELPGELEAGNNNAGQNKLSSCSLDYAREQFIQSIHVLDRANQRKALDIPQALFHTRESIESSLRALLLLHTGYKAHKEPLEVLIDYTCNFAAEAVAVFPRNTEEELRLFDMLVKASGRTSSWNVRRVYKRELNTLIDRAEAMSGIVEVEMAKREDGLSSVNRSPSTLRHAQDRLSSG